MRDLVKIVVVAGVLFAPTPLSAWLSQSWEVALGSLLLFPLGGLAVGARTPKPARKAALAGAMGYLASLFYSLRAVNWDLPSDGDTLAIPFAGMFIMAGLTAIGGLVAGQLFPPKRNQATTC